MANTLGDLREIVTKEIDEINKKGELDENSLVCAYKLIDILKDIGEIEGMDMGYSGRYMMDNGSSYRGGYSTRYSNRNRDSLGRYSRDYSYRGGYSRDGERDDIMAKMEHMMDTAGSETERQVIQRIMNQM